MSNYEPFIWAMAFVIVAAIIGVAVCEVMGTTGITAFCLLMTSRLVLSVTSTTIGTTRKR